VTATTEKRRRALPYNIRRRQELHGQALPPSFLTGAQASTLAVQRNLQARRLRSSQIAVDETLRTGARRSQGD